jgi:hypothetical protein
MAEYSACFDAATWFQSDSDRPCSTRMDQCKDELGRVVSIQFLAGNAQEVNIQ